MLHRERIALVTGASRGIGRAIAVKLAGEGAFVYINFLRNEDAAQEVLSKIQDTGGGSLCRFDVSNLESARKAVAGIVEEKGRIDILVNNAGILRPNLLVRMKENDWDSVIDTNLKGAFNCSQAVARSMMKRRWGRILCVSSMLAEWGSAGQANYCAAKAGLIGLTKGLARELGPRNICVNAVAPGLIETDMTALIPEKKQESIKELIPLGRIGSGEDVANLVSFLASDEAGYITGQVIHLNGGLYT